MTEIYSVKRLGTQQGGNWVSASGGKGYKDTYVVVTAPHATSNEVENATDIPRRHTPHPTDTRALVSSIRSEQQAEDVWYVKIIWTPPTPGDSQNEDPTLDNLKYRWDSMHYEDTRFKDLSNPPKAFVDGAETPFDPPPTFIRSNLKLIITRNQFVYDMDQAMEYANVVNKDEFWGQDPGVAKSDLPLASEQSRNGQPYWSVAFGFEFQKGGWNPRKVLNEGPRYRQLNVGGTIIVVAKDGIGVAHNGHVLLDDRGFPLLEGEEPQFVEFIMYEEKDFAPLGLDQANDPQLDPNA